MSLSYSCYPRILNCYATKYDKLTYPSWVVMDSEYRQGNVVGRILVIDNRKPTNNNYKQP